MQELQVPGPVRDAIEGFVSSLRAAFGDDLRSVVLYGSAAEGRMRATSDVNVLVVLRRFEREKVDAIREGFRFASAAVGLKAMFLVDDEVGEASREFAQKFADILRRRVVLAGDDPFAGLTIPRDALIRRVQQVLLNLTLRLRETYVERSLREEQAALTVADTAGPLRTSAAAILELEGSGTKGPKEALEELVASLGRADLQELLPHLSEAREQRALPPGRGAEILFRTLELARELHRRSLQLR